MKSKLIAVVLALFLGSGLVAADGSLSRERSTMPGQRFTISEYGTLLEVFDANGKSRFGKLTGDGFEVNYQSKGKTTSVSAVGDKDATGLLGGQVKAEGQSASITVTTADQALEITSYFILDEKAKKLIIHRKFRNISAGPLILQAMREYVDPALVATGQLGSSPSDAVSGQKQSLQAAKLAGLVKNQMGAGRVIKPWDCIAADCPKPPPPCLIIHCPEQFAFIPAQLITATDPLTGRLGTITLEWQDRVRLEPPPLYKTAKLLKNEVSALVYIDLPPPVEEIIR